MQDLITLTAAAERAGVSIITLKRILKDHNITIYKNPRDARVRLVKVADIDAVLEPTPINNRPNID